MMELKSVIEYSRFVPLKMLFSAVCFATIKCVTGKWGTSNCQKTTIREINGLVHAIIASYLSITAFLSKPRLLDDMITSSNVWAETCVSISTGYFLADSIIIIWQWCKGKNGNDDPSLNANILFHHLAAFGAFYYALCSQLFMGYSTMCLLLEVSSILLKARKIWKVNQLPGIGSTSYHVLAILNIILFTIFRLFVIVYAICWWSKNIYRLPLLYTILPFSGSIVVGVINIRYFHLLLKSDIIPILAATKPKSQ